MKIGVPREVPSGERRVALVPGDIPKLTKSGVGIVVAPGAGAAAGYPDEEYAKAGATIGSETTDIVLAVRRETLVGRGSTGTTVIGLLNPLGDPESVTTLAHQGITAFALELMPRITRAQNMDVLSSMATIAGYKAVLMAADALPRMLPLMMTAAGTLSAARVFVVGAGVAGLQAIATAKRLGAVVTAYDVRPEVRDQVQSVGGKFLEVDLPTTQASGEGGYARQLSDEVYRRQQELMAASVADADVVITTAAIPGKRAPVLVTRAMVEKMRPGSVFVDLAAEGGGNCEATRPGETVQVGGVLVIGTTNVPALVPYHASQLFSRNVTNFLLHLYKDGALHVGNDDEVYKQTLVCQGGDVVHPRLQALLQQKTVA